LDEHVLSGERAENRRLARVGVPDERGLEFVLPRLALNRAAALHVGEPLAQNLDAMVDQAAVRLELGFTGSAHADATAEFLEVGPHAREARQHVLELRELHLHLRLRGPRPRREDVQNQLGAIHHALAERIFDVLALAGAQLVVEDDERRLQFVHTLAELVELARAEIGARIGAVDLLRQLADDDGARGVGQLLELAQMFADGAARARTFERRADQQRLLDRRRDSYQIAAYVRILMVSFRTSVATDYRATPVAVKRPVVEYGTVKLPSPDPTVTSPST